nr:hypothetical protein [uncultured Allomuricauda sp.]
MKKIAFPLIAIFLVSSILTPSLLSLIGENIDIVLLTDSNEEEKQGEKESEKKFDEKDLFLNNFQFTQSDLTQAQECIHLVYVTHNSDFVLDILLPPPRAI